MQELRRPGEEYGEDPMLERSIAKEDVDYDRSLGEVSELSREGAGRLEGSRPFQTEKSDSEAGAQRTAFDVRAPHQDRDQYAASSGLGRENTDSQPVYAQSFANEPDRGYNAFFSRLEDGRHSLKHLAKHLQDRIDIEEDYARRLTKWSHENRERLEIGSLQAAMELTRNEYDVIANNRMRMVDELIDRVLAPIQSFAQHYKHIRESRREALQKSIKNREDQEQNVLKLRKNYDSRCHEAEQASIQQKRSLLGSGAERAVRAHPKIERAQTAVEQAERDYRLAEEKLRLLTTSWENDMIQFAEDFQSAENEHIDQLKSVHVDLVDVLVRYNKSEITELERISSAFGQLDNSAVINEFVAQCSPRTRDITDIERSRGQTELLPTSSAVSGKEKVMPFEAKVLYNYKAQKPEELTLEEGALVRVLSTKHSPWWEGEFRGSRGVFPSNYVARMA